MSDVAVEAAPIDDVLLRGLQDQRLATPTTVVGGYAQLQARWLGVGAAPDWVGDATVRRLVLFVAHTFSDAPVPMRAYTELEWENAVAGPGQPGAVEVEQAFLEADLAGDALAVRGGLLLVPFGIVNQWHEPPVFHGVDRPTLDQVLIPTTWRELGAGIAGQPGILRYELYAMTGLDASGFDDSGIGGGRRSGAFSTARAGALAGRLEAEPTLGVVLGASGYASDAGPSAPWYDTVGARRDLALPVLGAEVDARTRWRGIEARALAAGFWLPESDDLMEARRADGSAYYPDGASPVPTRMRGGYVELGYNVLQPTASTMELVPFARLEHVDTQAAVPETTVANPLRTLNEGTFGVTWRPTSGVAVKGDVQLRDRRLGDDELQWNLGLGWMF